VSGNDVTHGKPNPEPYLIALQKSGFSHHECLVIENAPLGIQSAKAAGLYTLAVNTGPLENQILLKAGADELHSSTQTMAKQLTERLARPTHP
jgi:beta-phosphoglucomutase-like phosphatase (HAD superfamily)